MAAIERQVTARAPAADGPPVLLLSPSAHLANVTFNGTLRQLLAWGLRLGGHSVRQVWCRGGLAPCMLAAAAAPDKPAPCADCRRANAGRVLPASDRWMFEAPACDDAGEAPETEGLDYEALAALAWRGLPLGRLCLPSVAWALRRHDPACDPTGPRMLAQFIRSAARWASWMTTLLDTVRPRCLIAFNGHPFPEAVSLFLAGARGIPTLTYEIGYRPATAFFSRTIASEYRFEVPERFVMTDDRERKLDGVLEARRRGEVQMGVVPFWPQISGLPADLDAAIRDHRRLAAVFTNVPFDTTQWSASTVFPNMFAWLDSLLTIARSAPDCLFVLRVHPDEDRAGKVSRVPVAGWLGGRGESLPANVRLLGPSDPTSSYALIDRSDLCLVYNSTVGIETACAGRPVVTAAATRYDAQAIAHMPEDARAYRDTVQALLDAPRLPGPEAEVVARARRYLYFMLFGASLDFGRFVERVPGSDHEVGLCRFEAMDLHPDRCPEIGRIHQAILNGGDVHYGEDTI